MISFTVDGDPQTKGSAKAFRSKSTGRTVVTNDNPKCKTWAATVAWKAKLAMAGAAPLPGPVRVDVVFALTRPKSLKGRKSGAYLGPLLDGDKLTRALWDALTGIVYADDKQVVAWSGSKAWAADGRPGVRVTVTPAGDEMARAVAP